MVAFYLRFHSSNFPNFTILLGEKSLFVSSRVGVFLPIDVSLLCLLITIGTRTGAKASTSAKKAHKTTNVAKKVVEGETNIHGVWMMKMTYREGANGMSGGSPS